MNKYEFFHNELTDMVNDRTDLELVAHYTWMSECAKFRDAVDYGEIMDKDAVVLPIEVNCSLFLDCDEFDLRLAVNFAEYGTKAQHRKHRKSRRMAKVNRRKNSRWVVYLDGTAKECKVKNHRAVRREYDIPVGKSNFAHKVNSYGYSW